MMNNYHDVSSGHQVLLLVLSQLTLIVIVGSMVFHYKRRSLLRRQICVGAMFLVNVVLYVFMQLGSRIVGPVRGPDIQIPYILLLAEVFFTLLQIIYLTVDEIRNRKIIDQRSIQESFNNLPTGICFFNEDGLPVLCNPAMHRFSFAVCGKDVQYITDLQACLSDDFAPEPPARKEGSLFFHADGSAWQLDVSQVKQKDGKVYIKYIAADITELQKMRMELTAENKQLRKAQAELRQLSANVVAITREEEILNAKMRVHDEMGRCLLTAQSYLKKDRKESIPNSIAASWQKAVSMLKYNNDTPDEDMLLQIRKICDTLRLSLVLTGPMPKQRNDAYILTCAIRECVTNAVRYAEATELQANFTETEQTATVTITNNGKTPEKEITEGGGLSNLRRRVERVGGTMIVRSLPRFELTVTIPKRKEEYYG